MDSNLIWKDCLEIIKITVSPAIYTTWFSSSFISKLEEVDDRVVFEIGCPTSFAKNQIEGRYFGLIQDTLSKITGKKCDVSFAVKDNPDKVNKKEGTPAPLFETQRNDQTFIEILRRSKIRPSFTFENFAVSGSNQLAHAAAEAVSNSLGTAYNPLFIWGGVGVGKTHLMVSVGNYALKNNDSLKTLFCTGEDFTNDIVEGIRNKSTHEVRNRYRKLDLLLVDDVQFIAGKDTVQEEFFHTFNAVTSAGGQIILTSDRPPSEISKLELRLRSRFEAGLIVDIAPPDFELRCAITQIKAVEKGLVLEPDHIQLIAANTDGARPIDGILTKLLTMNHLNRIPITTQVVEQALSKKQDENAKMNIRSTPDEAIDKVSKYFSIGKRSLLSNSRTRPIARPRQVLMYILRTHMGISLEEVGRLIKRDHTTVMHAVDNITKLALTDVQIRGDIERIKQII